jgi:large subunit ribosomal protein L24e
MVLKRQCSFCAGEVEPGTGTMFVKRDGTVFFFCTSSCRKQQLHLGRVGHRLKWTRAHTLKRAAEATSRAGGKNAVKAASAAAAAAASRPAAKPAPPAPASPPETKKTETPAAPAAETPIVAWKKDDPPSAEKKPRTRKPKTPSAPSE